MKESYLKSPLIRQLNDVCWTVTDLLANIFNLVVVESKLAKRSLKILCWLFPLVFIFVLSTWICFLATIFASLNLLGVIAPLNLLILTLLNFIILIVAKFLIKFHCNNLKFTHTRRQILSLKEKPNESSEKKAVSI